MARTSVLQLLSTEHQGTTLRAVIGREETGQYLAIERIERGKSEGDADSLLSQVFVDFAGEMAGTVFVTAYGFQGDVLSFAIEDMPGGNAKTCQLVGASMTAPSLRCVIARGGKLRR